MRRPRSAALTIALALSTTGGIAAAAAPTAAAASTSFYTAPASIPDQPGTLMKSEKFFTGLNIWGNPSRIMYSSLDTNGQPVAVTGTYIEPWGAWSGPGPRPVTSFSVGTIGQGDQCAPSKMMAASINLQVPGSLGVNYETTAINNLLAKGVAVVITDYVGLGLNDRPHSYMNHDDQAHAVLDAARVASKVPGSTVKPTSKVATYGYSQGGGASGAAVEAAPTYAPELDVAAAYVGAPPADLVKTLAGIDASPIVGVLGYFINGASAENSAVKSFVDANINAKGKAMLARTAGQCTVDTVAAFGGQKTSTYTLSGESVADVMAKDADVTAFVDAQRIGRLKPTAAVRLATGVADDVVPHGQARQLAVDWCSLGSNVTYVPVNNQSAGAKSILNHAGPLLSDQGAARDWVVARLAGQQAESNCGAINSLK